MTLEHADKIAERIITLPRLYETPAQTPYNYYEARRGYGTGYPWCPTRQGSPIIKENLYNAASFVHSYYSGTITDWDKTKYGHSRYITIDDLKMMAYVGIEYARAKLYGWRFRYGDLGEAPGTYPRGYIVRTENGKRYVKRTSGGYAPPNHFTWTPMQRMPGFQVPESGRFKWPETEDIPTESTSQSYLLGSIEGNDDVLKIGTVDAPYGSVSSPFALIEADTFVKNGGFSIRIIQREDDIDEASAYDEDLSVVCFQQRVFPIYQIFYTKEDRNANNQNFYLGQSLREDEKNLYRRKFVVYSCSGAVSLRKGIVYDVYAKFDNAELRGTSSNSICSYVRTPTRMAAPYMWQSKYL